MQISQSRIYGLAAALAAVSIWSVFILVTRFAVKGDFSVEELLVLRLVPAFVVLMPWMWRFGVVPRGLSWPRAFMLGVGATALFPYIFSKGLEYAPAADAGALAPGMLPFWTALAAFYLAGERPERSRRIGLAMILLGAMVVSLWQILAGTTDGAWKGHLMFLGAAGLWAVYSVIFRQSGYSPMQALVISMFWGTLTCVPLMFATGNVTFDQASHRDIGVMIVIQSFVVGILAMLLYSFAVRSLGAAQTGAFGALTPILALLGGIVFLAETTTALTVVGVCLVAAGVFLASGVLGKSQAELATPG